MKVLSGNSTTRNRLATDYIILSVVTMFLVLVCGLLVTFKPILAMAAIGVTLVTFAVMASANMATYLVIFILYANIAVVAVNFHGVPKLLGLSFPLLLAIPLIHHLVLQRKKFVLDQVLAMIVLFLLVQSIGLLFSRNIIISSKELVELFVEGIVLYVLIINVVRTPESLRWATWALLFAGFIMSSVPIYQQMTQSFGNEYGGFGQITDAGFLSDKMEGGRQFRLSGTLGEQNRFAQNLLVLLPLGFFLILNEKSKGLQLMAIVFTTFSALGFLLAFSRGGAIALALLLVILFLMRILKARHLLYIVLVAMLGMAVLPQYWSRVTTIKNIPGMFSSESTKFSEADSSIKGRITEMWAALEIFSDNPVIGVGPGMYKHHSQKYGNKLGIHRLKEARQAHSLYLGIMAENGALGLLSFLSILFVALHGLHLARKHWKQSQPHLANMATAYMLALIAYMATGLFLHLSYIRFFYLILALAGVACILARREWTPKSGGGVGTLSPSSSDQPHDQGGLHERSS